MIKIEKVFNVITGEETFIERPENAAEKKDREKKEAELQLEAAEAEAQAKAKAALLERLGITEDEAKLLLS